MRSEAPVPTLGRWGYKAFLLGLLWLATKFFFFLH